MGTEGSVHHRPGLLIALAAVLVGTLAACGIDEGVVAREAAEASPGVPDTTEAAGTGDGSTEPTTPVAPTPFVVGEVPEGYELLVVGTGEQEPGGDQRPVTVLAPDGEPVGSDVVFVEPAVDDEEAFVAATDDQPWALLRQGGVRVWGLEATEDDLAAIAAAATPPSTPGDAPTVEDPPGDLEVAGHITADGVLALAAGPSADEDGPVPGPASAQVSVWTCTEDCSASLTALTLPPGTLDPGVVVGEARLPRRATDEARDAVAEEVTVGEATGVVTTTALPDTGAVIRRELAVELADGVVLVLISRGTDLLEADALVAVAESVEL